MSWWRRLWRRPEAATPAPVDPLRSLGHALSLGEVVAVRGRDLWLGGAWLVDDGGRPWFALVAAREETAWLWVAQREIAFAREVPVSAPPGEPPSVMEVEGASWRALARRPITLHAVGEPPAQPFERGWAAQYRGLEGRSLWLLSGDDARRGFVVERLEARELERWGKADEDEATRGGA